MQRGLKYSLIMHATVVAFFSFDFFGIIQSKIAPSEVPLIIDLANVKITEITNLPPKIEKKKEEPLPKKEPEKKVEKKEEPKFLPPVKPAVKPPVPKKVEVDPKAAKLEVSEEKKEEPKKKDDKKKADAKSEDTKKKEEPENLALKSLLASVNQIEKSIKEEETKEDNGEDSDEGIVGGSGGFLGRDLTISEKDALAAKIRQCWNFDAGAKGIEDMVIEMRAYLNPDGSVREVDILDMRRYNRDGFFRSIAESARRAVFICSPFSMLPERHPEKFDTWKTLYLRFNPMDGGVF